MYVVIPLAFTILYMPNFPFQVKLTINILYGLLTLRTIISRGVPYIFGSSANHKKHFIKFENTHSFLPARGDNIVPNTLHVILHSEVWVCFVLSLYL